jgi:plastocyanin
MFLHATTARPRLLVCLSLALFFGLSLAAAAGDRLTGVVRVDGRPRKDVVIWLDGVSAPALPEPATVVLDQRNLEFVPHVLAVRVGTHVRMPNSDRVFHNVFSFHDGKRFDLGLYPVGTSKLVTFDRPGLSRIFCNIHPAMAGYLIAVDSAFFAVTDGKGGFSIDNVPAGTHAYRLWRPGQEVRTGTLTAAPGRPVEIDWP